MSTPAQKANLARIRDNQRRSRARRREYLQELEQRLRVYELQGVEASAEVQVAARRVAEENRQLRGLLNRHGIGDEYISSYLTSGGAAQADPSPVTPFSTGNTGENVQSLRHLIAPRRPTMIDPNVPYAVPPQDSREASIASVSTSSSSLWDSTQPTMSSYARAMPPTVPSPMGRASISGPLPSQSHAAQQVFIAATAAPRMDPYPAPHNPGALLEDPRQQGYALATMHHEGHPAINYSIPINPYHHPGTTDPGHPGC